MARSQRAHRPAVWGLVLLVTIGVAAPAGATTINFDELPSQRVDGISLLGVTFHFAELLPGVTAFFNASLTSQSGRSGAIGSVEPSLVGPIFTDLTLDFVVPVSTLQFQFALTHFFPAAVDFKPGVTVHLFDSALTESGTVSVDGVEYFPSPALFEGLFSYVGPPVTRAVLDFRALLPGQSAELRTRFGLDNLTFEAAQVPEPGPFHMLLAGLASLAVWSRSRAR